MQCPPKYDPWSVLVLGHHHKRLKVQLINTSVRQVLEVSVSLLSKRIQILKQSANERTRLRRFIDVQLLGKITQIWLHLQTPTKMIVIYRKRYKVAPKALNSSHRLLKLSTRHPRHLRKKCLFLSMDLRDKSSV